MPFLGLHPGPFIPKGAREQLSHFLPDWGGSSPPSPIASGFLRATRGHRGWQGRACGISADEEISQIASQAVNTNDSQQGGITETDASSSRSQGLQKGLSAGAHSSPFAWLRKSTAWWFNGDWQEQRFSHPKVPKTQKDPFGRDCLQLGARERHERKRSSGFLPGKLVPI